jgi:hypothetical protein
MASRPFVGAAAGSRDRWRRPGWYAALVATVALAAASCSGSTGPVSSSRPKTTLTACTAAGRNAECGYVSVPQDWAHPAGMWTPRQNLSPALQHIGNYTPLDAAVQAMDSAMQGHFPPTRPLLVMAAYAAAFGIVAIKAVQMGVRRLASPR